MVGGEGFEPSSSRSRTVRAAKLRQPPIGTDSIGALMETPTALWWRSGRGPDLHRVGCLAVLEGEGVVSREAASGFHRAP